MRLTNYQDVDIVDAAKASPRNAKANNKHNSRNAAQSQRQVRRKVDEATTHYRCARRAAADE